MAAVKGRFTEFNGDGQITDTKTIFGRIDIHAASVDTRMRNRNKRLRAQATIDRKDFDVNGNLMGMVPDRATISGDVVLRRAR